MVLLHPIIHGSFLAFWMREIYNWLIDKTFIEAIHRNQFLERGNYHATKYCPCFSFVYVISLWVYAKYSEHRHHTWWLYSWHHPYEWFKEQKWYTILWWKVIADGCYSLWLRNNGRSVLYPCDLWRIVICCPTGTGKCKRCQNNSVSGLEYLWADHILFGSDSYLWFKR